jgi:mannose-6-phosphate isomerase-like protein (cupin superfamily)
MRTDLSLLLSGTRWLLVTLLLGSSPVRSEIHDVIKSAEVDKLFARIRVSLDVIAKTNYALVFRTGAGDPVASQKGRDADEFWFVRRGAAKLSLGEKEYQLGAGDVVNLPRTTGYRIAPGGSRFEYVAVRVFPTERLARIGIGAGPVPRPMPDVATQKQIDETFATAEKNVTLHSAGATLINHVVYKGTHGPWEVHQNCEDIYFVRMGTARAQIDGTLVNAKQDSPGEIRGTGVTGAREFTIVPGDMVVIPRNTAHFMDPGAGKVGYLLVKVCD